MTSALHSSLSLRTSINTLFITPSLRSLIFFCSILLLNVLWLVNCFHYDLRQVSLFSRPLKFLSKTVCLWLDLLWSLSLLLCTRNTIMQYILQSPFVPLLLSVPSPPDVFNHIPQANRHVHLLHRLFFSLWLIPRLSFTSFSSFSAGIATLIMAVSSMSSPKYSPTPVLCPHHHHHHHPTSTSSEPLKSSSGASL